MINDVDPGYDVCSEPSDQVMMAGKNIGDLLNAAGVTWGGFMGGFNLDTKNANGTHRLQAQHPLDGGRQATSSTTSRITTGSSITPRPPTRSMPARARCRRSATASSTTARPANPANHQYGLHDFYDAVKAGNFPSVSYIKLPAYQDGHAGYSDPLDEQAGIVALINFLEQQPGWKSTAVIVTWDDSDGWYDHAFAKPTSPSFDPEADQLDGPGKCGSGTPPAGRRRQAGERPLRSRHAPAVPGDLALGEGQSCRP